MKKNEEQIKKFINFIRNSNENQVARVEKIIIEFEMESIKSQHNNFCIEKND